MSSPAITGNIDHSRAIHIFPDPLKPYKPTSIAYGASFIATTIGFPLDTVKTRMQTHDFSGYLDCFKKTYRSEGLRGFFRGIWAPLLSTSLSKSLNVSLFTTAKPYCYDMLYQSSFNPHPFLRNIPVCFMSGMVAGAGVSLFACPFEFTKVYAQISLLVEKEHNLRSYHKDSTLRTFRSILTHGGLPGLYSGYKHHLLRDSLSSGIYYCIYESFKWGINAVIDSKAQSSSPIAILLSGGLSGVMCWALIFPVDTTKSLIQKDAVRNIVRKEHGLDPEPAPIRKIRMKRSLYRGLGISVTRSFIVNMVFFSSFEFVMAHVV